MRAQLLTAFAVCFLLAGSTASAQHEVVEYYALDNIGSVRVVFDQGGTIVSRRDYEPFGTPVVQLTLDPKIYAGLFHDDESGLEYAQARMYRAKTGRFLSVDPVYAGFFNPQAWNRYAYALNSPLKFVDPEGLQAMVIRREYEFEFRLDPLGNFFRPPIYGDAPLPLVIVGPLGRGPGPGPTPPPPGPPPPGPPPPGPTPPGPTPPGPPSVDPDEERTREMVRGFVQGCKEGAAIVADVAIPFVDPFSDHYGPDTPGLGTSQFLANASIGVLNSAMVIRGLANLAKYAPFSGLNQGQSFRIGPRRFPRTQGKVPGAVLTARDGTKMYWDLRVCRR
jgi:RHS repeat-associated protein